MRTEGCANQPDRYSRAMSATLPKARRWLILAPVAALICTSASWTHYAITGSFRLAEEPRSAVLTQMSILASAGLLLLGASCLAMFRHIDAALLRPVFRSALAVHVCLLFALPLFSNDLFTYLLYGELAARGLDMRVATPADLGDPELVALTSWGEQASVYGPLSNLLFSFVGHIGHKFSKPLLVSGICYKLITGALDALGLYGLYRHVLRSPSPGALRGFALFALNPLLAWEVAGQGHNDGLVVAFATFYVLSNNNGWKAASVVHLTLGTLAKFVLGPAVAIHLSAVARTDLRRALRLALLAASIALAFYGPAYLDSQGRFSVFPALRKDHFGSLSHAVLHVCHALGLLQDRVSFVVLLLSWVGKIIVMAVFALAIYRARRVEQVPHCTFVVLLAAICTSNVLAPWYLCWLLPFVAREEDRRWQVLVLAITLVGSVALGIPRLVLLLPACQLAGLLALLLWMAPPKHRTSFVNFVTRRA